MVIFAAIALLNGSLVSLLVSNICMSLLGLAELEKSKKREPISQGWQIGMAIYFSGLAFFFWKNMDYVSNNISALIIFVLIVLPFLPLLIKNKTLGK